MKLINLFTSNDNKAVKILPLPTNLVESGTWFFNVISLGKTNKDNKGFSLTEVMMSMAIFMFIMAGLYTMLYVSNISGQSQNASVSAQEQARATVDLMTRDLRVAQGLVINQDTDNVNATFNKPGEGNVAYNWTTDPGDDANRIIRTTATRTRIIARDISALVLTDGGDDVTIDVTASVESQHADTVDFQLVSKVTKR